ncbi:MAG: putative sliding-clamp-loader subunit [Prokaryotic dsDNA virus sp.]|jgi:DNA polymerase III delta prime subunit|nr:MAG: putative sliding-clamp-loader subunit [Prokaryotic dsDNA virus sp.]|tara:strand:+ start:1216 stop:2088 length:873 start_codon:yes stop_codon:yes gene_type:complete
MSKLWAVKHRPSLDEIVGQDRVLDAIPSMGHMIFHSPEAGTGKTSLANALAERYDFVIHTFNASSKKTRGIEFVEEELLPMSRTGNWKQIFLLDEADQLTASAQSALKGVIENATGYFILTCNDLSKISTWLQSRCRVLHFKPIADGDMKDRLTIIAGKEGVEINDTQLDLIIEANKGDLRSAINCLQAYAGMENGDKFLHSLLDDDFQPNLFLTMVFREKDYEEAYKCIVGFDPRRSVRRVFLHAVDSNARTASKLAVIDASVTAERDFIAGVEPAIVIANFVRMCLDA